MDTNLSVYDVLTEKLTDIKEELKTLRQEQVTHGKSIATLKAQLLVIYTLVMGIIVTIVRLFLDGVS